MKAKIVFILCITCFAMTSLSASTSSSESSADSGFAFSLSIGKGANAKSSSGNSEPLIEERGYNPNHKDQSASEIEQESKDDKKESSFK
jgi:hypothetical protein